MHFFIQSKNRSNHSSRQKLNVQNDNAQKQKKVIKKIVVRKKTKQKLQDLNEQIIEAQSQFNVPDSTVKSKPIPRDKQLNPKYLKMSPFGSFMANDPSEQQLQTPFLMSGSTPNYQFQSLGKTIEASQQQHIEQQQQQQNQQYNKKLVRIQSKPIQNVSRQNQILIRYNKRKNSMQTDLQNFNRQMNNKYPTELSSQGDQNSVYYNNQNYHNDYVIDHKIHRTARPLPKIQTNQNGEYPINSHRSTGNLLLNNSEIRPRINSNNFANRQDINQQNQQSLTNTNFQDITSLVNGQIQLKRLSSSQKIKPINLSLLNSKTSLTHRNNNQREYQMQNQTRKQKQTTQKSRRLSILHEEQTPRDLRSDKEQHQKSFVSENRSFQKNKQSQSKYYEIIQKQTKQLQLQKQRMANLTQEANKVIYKEDGWMGQQKTNHHIEKSNVDAWTAFKYILQQLIQLFCMGEVIKYQLKYRSYQILTKIYAQASKYFQQDIQVQQPIKSHTFTVALKAILSEYQKSQLDIIINKIFNLHSQIFYQQFFHQFQSILNSKQVSLFQPSFMKKQVDRTIDKVTRLFVIWIEIQYFTKKTKQILRTNKSIYDSILIECSNQEDPDKFDIQLVEKFLLQTAKKSVVRKLKIDVFFRHLLGPELLKKKWTDWIHIDDLKVYNRLTNKSSSLTYQRKQYVSKLNNNQNQYNYSRPYNAISNNQNQNSTSKTVSFGQNTPSFNKYNTNQSSNIKVKPFTRPKKIQHRKIEDNDSKYEIGTAALNFVKSYAQKTNQQAHIADYSYQGYNNVIHNNSNINNISKRQSLQQKQNYFQNRLLDKRNQLQQKNQKSKNTLRVNTNVSDNSYSEMLKPWGNQRKYDR